MSDSLQTHGLQPARILCPWNSPGKNTGVGCYSLFQKIFPTQGWNLHLLHCRQILHHLSQGIRLGPILTQPTVSVFIRREIFHMKTWTHGENVMQWQRQGLEWFICRPRNAKDWWPPVEPRKKEGRILPEHQREYSSDSILISDFWPLELWEEIPPVDATQPVGICYGSYSKQTHHSRNC